ncbi:hypothetical protein SDC9_147460 [bioreactor metagenome]|uniref:Uncharacterized protein n=1 Tax=bioreactor metagenome TaxID=1076179 RepID=A0A645EFR1_9ZZZZ
MINAALIENSRVSNIIYIDETNFSLFASMGMQLIDTATLGLQIGDYSEGGTWYRNIDGAPIALPFMEE